MDALEACSTRSDVRDLLDRHGRDNVGQAWKQLDPLTKSALLLVKNFDGTIIRESQPVRDQQAHPSRAEDDERPDAAKPAATR